jgi:hypothetical protein
MRRRVSGTDCRWRGIAPAARPRERHFGSSSPSTACFGPSFHLLCHRGRQVSHPHQVVSRGSEGEHPADPHLPAMPRLTHHANRLHPAKDLLDPLARSQGQFVATVPGRACIERTRLLRALADVRRHTRGAKPVDETCLIESAAPSPICPARMPFSSPARRCRSMAARRPATAVPRKTEDRPDINGIGEPR